MLGICRTNILANYSRAGGVQKGFSLSSLLLSGSAPNIIQVIMGRYTNTYLQSLGVVLRHSRLIQLCNMQGRWRYGFRWLKQLSDLPESLMHSATVDLSCAAATVKRALWHQQSINLP